ncbi:protein involved in plasmid replication-relaxation [Umezawaea tangerina]|uniref:Protein involved in plasmid replication-relaxation n=1 Tax=Umezawaea tangerina TaxID=84725 RepID=A0A2T0T4G1_9PSEU|nr:protein involved in plasmid replication-relaxation [Umezawaea tangerina]
MQRLAKLGLVVRFGRSVGGIRAGSKGHTIGLTGLGEAVLDVGQDQGRRHRQVWEGKPYFQDHTLAIAELHTSLTEHIAANGDADLIAFETEPKVWRRFGGIGGSLTLKPDYLAHIGVGDIERVVFVEIDLGTESLPSVLRKCQVYLQYWQAGIEQHLHGLFPSVLWLVPDGRRRGRLQEGVERLPRDAQALFTIALLHEGAQLLTTNGGLA